MNGVHDLGGMHGFGPVVPELNEPVFHFEWERRMFALAFAFDVSSRTNADEFRYAIERMDPAHYLSTSYYEHWLHAIETLLVEKGIVTPAEMAAAGVAIEPRDLRAGFSRAAAPIERPRRRARFRPGDRVVARNLNPQGHTRLPHYARGKPGVVTRDLRVFALPDTNAHGAGRNPQHCYTVCFRARDLWGNEAGARERVYIDLWEDYLALAQTGQRGAGRETKR